MQAKRVDRAIELAERVKYHEREMERAKRDLDALFEGKGSRLSPAEAKHTRARAKQSRHVRLSDSQLKDMIIQNLRPTPLTEHQLRRAVKHVGQPRLLELLENLRETGLIETRQPREGEGTRPGLAVWALTAFVAPPAVRELSGAAE